MINRFAVMSSSICAFIISASAIAEVPPIEKIAPENSVIVLGTRNVAQAMENVKKTRLWTMWQSEKMTALREEQMKEAQEQIKKMMTDLGVEEDSLTWPAGAAGLALFTVVDPDLGTPEIALMAYADYGAEADKTDELIKAALAQGAKDGKLEYEEKDVAGRNVFAIDLSKMQPAEEEGAEEDDFGGGMPMLPIPSVDDLIGGLMNVNYVRDGSTLMLSSDMTALTDALDGIDGKGDAAGKFAAREDFQNTVEQVGGEGDLYAVMLTRDVMELAGEGGMMLAMARPMVRTLTGEVAGYVANLRFETGTAMVEQSYGAYMPNGKKGLTALMDNPGPRSDVPAFVAADAASFTSMNFDFSGLMDVVKSVVNSNPMLAGQAGEVMEQVEPMATPILNALGGKMVMADSVMAFECKDPQGFENGFAGLAAQGGLESRDFLGQRIYTMKEGMNIGLPGMGGGGAAEPMSIGIGGGYVFMGGTPDVEGALRATGATDAPTLGKSDAFQKAVGALGNEPVVGWGYTDLVSGYDEAIRAQIASMKAGVEEAKEFDPELGAEMEKEIGDAIAEMEKSLESINAAFLKQYIGPMVWQVRSNDKGFVMNAYLLPAAE